MKNLHKKIGAMFLAGMVVLGGVAVSGVNSFAASSNNKVVVKNSLQQSNYQKVERMANKFNGEIVKDSNNNKEFKNYLKEKKIKNNNKNPKILYDNSRSDIRNQSQIALPLNNAKNRKIPFVAIQFQGKYYLIQINL